MSGMGTHSAPPRPDEKPYRIAALTGAIRVLLANPRSAEARRAVDAARDGCSDEDYETAMAVVQQAETSGAELPAAGAPVSGAPAWLSGTGRLAVMAAIVVLTAAGLGAYTGAASYDTVWHLAAAHGVALPRLNPLGIDGGLVGVILLDITVTWLGEPIWWLRLAARVFAGAVVAANAAAGWPSPVGVGLRVGAPVLFVIITETGRTLLLRRRHAAERERKAAERQQRRDDRIPRVRWLLDLRGTLAIWRRMRLWREPSYAKAVAMELERLAAIEKLAAEYGPAWQGRVPADLAWMLTSGVRMQEALTRAAELVSAEERDRGLEAELRETRASVNAQLDRVRAEYETKLDVLRADLAALLEAEQTARETAEIALASARSEAEEAAARVAVLERKLSGPARRSRTAPARTGTVPRTGARTAPEDDLELEAKALKLLATNLDMSGAELARKLGVSEGYGRKLRRRLGPDRPAEAEPDRTGGGTGPGPAGPQ